MTKEEVIRQSEVTLQEMIQARNDYCKMKEKVPIVGQLMEGLDLITVECEECCCLGTIIILVLAIPCWIIWQIEEYFLNKKAKKIFDQSREKCSLYLQNMQEYVKWYYAEPICLNATTAFVNNKYIGTLNKKKVFFGLLQKDEDWRMRSIDMAIQEVKGNLQWLISG